MSAILDTVVSLILVFLVFSIVVSGLQEWWSQYRGQRGRFLRLGMQRLIGDEAVFARVLQHPLIGSLYKDRAARGKPPAYVDPRNFALAFADVVLRRAAAAQRIDPPPALTYEALRDAILLLGRQQHSATAIAVLPILERATDLPTALAGIEAWYGNAMDRVSGWYKAYAQRRLFVWGLVVACLANVDSIAIYRALAHSPETAASLAGVAQKVVDGGTLAGVDVKALETRAATPAETAAIVRALAERPVPGLPLGYACLGVVAAAETAPATSVAPISEQAATNDALKASFAACKAEFVARTSSMSFFSWLLQIAGWVITALAGVIGAPYWFGLLTKVVNIRGAGPKPEPKPAAG